MLDIFLSVAYDFYYDKLNHKPTITLLPEEKKEQEIQYKKINREIKESPEEIIAR